jgi:hypothetical protein
MYVDCNDPNAPQAVYWYCFGGGTGGGYVAGAGGEYAGGAGGYVGGAGGEYAGGGGGYPAGAGGDYAGGVGGYPAGAGGAGGDPSLECRLLYTEGSEEYYLCTHRNGQGEATGEAGAVGGEAVDAGEPAGEEVDAGVPADS